MSKLPKNTELIMDETDDPIMWGDFDQNLSNHFNTKIIQTLTMIDWKENHNIIQSIFQKTKFPQISSFKKRIDELYNLSKKVYKTKSNPSGSSIHALLDEFSIYKNKSFINYGKLYEMIKQKTKELENKNFKILNFPKMNSTSLESQVQSYIKKTSSILKDPKWYKPDTCADATLFSQEEGLLKTSKASFLFSLGLLDPLKAYMLWGDTKPSDSKIGSATDQILWREFFHATSKFPGFWAEYTKKTPFWETTHKWTKVVPSKLAQWNNGETDKKDLNMAMIQLQRDGWIHHLQRHVVADYLTRGGLNYDWKIGEKWFRKTLIDHDAAVNRANWMWLSAVAFSSKQKILHYNHDNYISRHSNVIYKKSRGGKGKKILMKNTKTDEAYSIHIFTRDLRIQDHKVLNSLNKNNLPIIPIFIFTPEQVTKNEFKSDRSVKFMCQSLKELANSIPLLFFYGKHEEVLNDINKKINIHTISISEDYTPYARMREDKIEKWCKSREIQFLKTDNHCLTPPQNIFSGSMKPYQIFTPYYNEARKHSNLKIYETIPKNRFQNFKDLKDSKEDLKFEVKDIDTFYEGDPNLYSIEGGRQNGLKKLENLKNHLEYETQRNRIDKESTKLSAYLKFGVIGIRETHKIILDTLQKRSEPLIRELHFRDFYMYVAYHYSHVFGDNFRKDKAFHQIWNNNPEYIKAWKNGKTGVPMVDAAMRELNETGFMHNRGRMVVAMFLTKNLLCDWKIGEKYFATQLIDYDPCSNNGGWQWSASTGADGSPYTRIMNPFTQFEKTDPQGVYTKNNIPEIREISFGVLKKWETMCKEAGVDYNCPIVNVKESRKKAIELFR
tara:strand:- start:6275 stop:8791 length:2517 start_codon:yes stop_codon:yes gene_type:complete